MKAAAFSLSQPDSLTQAHGFLTGQGARAIAGGQSLGAMLNLRVAQPAVLVPLTRLADLTGVAEDAAGITLGAAVTHADIEDGRAPDLAGNILARVAAGIAYRAVRNRGTIGGSLCHADPAADWVTVLTALGAEAIVASASGTRTMPVADFVRGAFQVALAPGEILRAVRIGRPSAQARWGYFKACRKPGEFAHAMAAVLIDGSCRRAVIGAVGGRPVVLEGDAAVPEAVDQALLASGLDRITRHMQTIALRRALDKTEI